MGGTAERRHRRIMRPAITYSNLIRRGSALAGGVGAVDRAGRPEGYGLSVAGDPPFASYPATAIARYIAYAAAGSCDSVHGSAPT